MKKNLTRFMATFIAMLTITSVAFAQNNNDAAIEAKINSLIKKMTLEEKITMLHANSIFKTGGIPRLGIPGLSMDDGPLGVREELSSKGEWESANLTTDSATFFPNGSALAATWNPSLAYRYGVALGEEARARGKDVILAPAINITRDPINGRTYEYLSEDPFLNSQLAVNSIKGIQTQNVAACVKHFALNNQETNRANVNVEVSERALREIYLPAFKASIEEGNAWSIMSAYNKVRGEYCSQNAYLLNTILKGEWSFKGIVISDWSGTHSTVAAANNGLDVEMGSKPPYENFYFAKRLLDSVKAGKVSEKTIDEKVHRILRVLYKTSLSKNRAKGSINTVAHNQTVYDIASESIVLLKNEKHLLPLNTAGIKTIAVIGDNATRTNHSGGYGAGVKAKYEITPLQGLQHALGKTIQINFAQGYRPGVNQDDPSLITEAVNTAKKSDIAILFIGGNRDYESEGLDRKDLSLPFGEQALVDAVTAANANTIVVVIGGAPYDINKIKKDNQTIVWSWFNGSEGGHALADVLTGKVNPSGKLPFTFPVSLDESPAFYLHTFPGDNLTADYKEGILVGYRWYDTKNIAPLYPFGYGLSYTDFKYSELKTDKKDYKNNENITVTTKVKNTGKRAGKEIVELYIGKPNSAVERAEKELKAFKKVMVPAGKEVTVTLSVPVKSLAYYDEGKSKWVVEPGKYNLMVGKSSKDIKGTETINIEGGN